MTLQDILSDSKTFTDDMEMQLGDNKIKLGDLRNMSASRQKELSDKIANAQTYERKAIDDSVKVAELLAKLESTKDTLSQQKVQPAGDDDFNTAEWWKPVREQLSSRDKKIDDAIKGIEALTNTVKQAANVWFKDRSRSQFKEYAPRLKKVDQYKDWDENKVLEFAAQQKLVDEDGLPSVAKAIQELTKENELDRIRKEAYEEGMKKGRTSARMESMPRPSSATGGKMPKGKSAVEEMGLEGLGDDVMSDPELMEALGDLQNLDKLQ